MFRRTLASAVLEALENRPVVLLHGARQTGKTTLAREIAAKHHPSRYLTLDDAAVLAAIKSDATGFLAGLDGPVVLDEVQRAPEVFIALKASVDRDRRPGRFLLTGSANVLMLPRLSESLAGRMEILTLWPLSQGEIEGTVEGFVDTLFREDPPKPPSKPVSQVDLLRRILRGGYPEPVQMASERRRRAWYGSYVTTILQRDVRDIANIEDLTALPRLLSLLAARSMSLLNYADLARDAGLPQTTLKRYFALLEATFLARTVPAWFTNVTKRIAKAPKVLLTDTGLAAYALGLDAERLTRDPNPLGALVENFVAMELTKQIGWSEKRPALFHFRTQTGAEVDLVLENPAGGLVGIEVKAAATVSGQDFRGLRALADAVPRRFHRGVVLYTGAEVVPFGERLHAVPVSGLWQMSKSRR